MGQTMRLVDTTLPCRPKPRRWAPESIDAFVPKKRVTRGLRPRPISESRKPATKSGGPPMFRRPLPMVIVILAIAAQSARADITTGLIARYTFDGNANDVSGNNNHGTLVGGITLTTDRFGGANRAYSFNGSNSYISVPASATLNSPTTGCTQAAWVYLYGTSL